MNVLLEAIHEARELRDAAEREYQRAIVRASEAGLSLRAIAPFAGITFSNVAKRLRREEKVT